MGTCGSRFRHVFSVVHQEFFCLVTLLSSSSNYDDDDDGYEKIE